MAFFLHLMADIVCWWTLSIVNCCSSTPIWQFTPKTQEVSKQQTLPRMPSVFLITASLVILHDLAPFHEDKVCGCSTRSRAQLNLKRSSCTITQKAADKSHCLLDDALALIVMRALCLFCFIEWSQTKRCTSKIDNISMWANNTRSYAHTFFDVIEENIIGSIRPKAAIKDCS